MALPVVVQTPNTVSFTTVTAWTIAFAGACAVDNSIVVGIGKSSGTTRSVASVADNVTAGNYTHAVTLIPVAIAAGASIYYHHTITAGTPTITWTWSGNCTGWIAAAEVSGLDSAASPTTGSLSEGGTNNNHTSNASALTGTNVFTYVAGSQAGVSTTVVVGSGYTAFPAQTSVQQLLQYVASASFNDAGPWSTTGAAKIGHSAMAVFPSPAAVWNPGLQVKQAVNRAATY